MTAADRLMVAHHECAHAVAAIVMGRQVARVRLGPLVTADGRRCDGLCEFNPGATTTRQIAVGACAGAAAEAEYLRRRNRTYRPGSSDVDDRQLARLAIEFEVRDSIAGDAVRAVSDALEAHARRRAAVLVRLCWAWITVAANELNRRGSLSGDDVRRLKPTRSS